MFDIDFVITWVDNSDPLWIEEFNKYVTVDRKLDTSKIRFRDNGLLKYWFRGVEQYAPWVRKIHFVTYGHIPNWLNRTYSKLHIVNHKDFIPIEYLPVFSSHPIEHMMHKIPDLSEHFVYFNDDFFIINKVLPTDFFTSNGGFKDMAVLYNIPISKFASILLNNENLIREHFDITQVIKSSMHKWLNLKYGINILCNILLYRWRNSACVRWNHFAQPYTKSLLNEVWSNCGDAISTTMKSKFRSDTDINHFIYRTWYLMKGDFEPYNFLKDKKYYNLSDNVNLIRKDILGRKTKQIVINDHQTPDDEMRYRLIKEAFNQKFPNKSKFEL